MNSAERIVSYFENQDLHKLSYNEREKRGLAGDMNYVFGNSDPLLFLSVIKELGLKKRDVFVDLGSGAGICTLLASQYTGRSIGIEILGPLFEFSKKATADLGIKNAEFIKDDVRKVQLHEATVAYMYNSTWQPSFLYSVVRNLEQWRSLKKVVTYLPFESKVFGKRIIIINPITSVYIQKKKKKRET